MPQPTGVRAFHLPIPGLAKKSARTHVDPEKPASSSSSTITRTDLHLQQPSSAPAHGTMDKLTARDVRKSLHLPGRSSSPAKKSSKASPRLQPTKPAQLSIDIESPPLIFHGNPANSTGALMSGQLRLNVTDPDLRIQTYTMKLQARVSTRKPVSKDCADCTSKNTEIHSWKFLSEPTTFKKGQHSFPFSHLLKGHLPATSHGDVGSMDYYLAAVATTAAGDTLTVEHQLTVQRALMPGPDRNSERIFPPTNLRALVVTPSVVHPIGSFPVQMRLVGLKDSPMKDVQRRWRVRKMSWRIDEIQSIISAACPKHAHKVGGEGKGILHESTHVIGGEEIKNGWKTDFDTPGGMTEMEFTASIDVSRRAVCDVDSAKGLSSSHNLTVEIIVMEEQISLKANRYATPTGNARVLRMQFKLLLTERAGLGISWDEELPPMYEDVERSPPGYTKIENYEGDLSLLPRDEELETMQEPQAGPSAAAQP